MKIAIITRHAISNYGSLLQAYATQCIFKELGHQPIIIDYIRNDERPIHLEKTIIQNKPSWNQKVFKRLFYLSIRTPESLLAGLLFGRERRRLLDTTKRYTSEEDLREDPPAADLYVVGSDQVWGPMASGVYDSSYVLAFAPKDARRICYASSFGKGELPESVMQCFTSAIKSFDKVLVREDSAVNLLLKWGIQAQQVLDPTLLLSADKWRKIERPIKEKGFILVYQIHNNPLVGQYAKTLAHQRNLPLLRISASLHQISWGGKFHFCPNLGEFIGYIDKADCLITDSFHGTAFAINLNTPFVEVLPDNGTAGRNASILKLTGLNSRIAHSIYELSIADNPIDYDKVNQTISKERSKSIRLLSAAVKGEISNEQ